MRYQYSGACERRSGYCVLHIGSSGVFSVIVPVYNDWSKVTALLSRLAQVVKHTPSIVEVILVDNGSEVGTIPSNVPSFAKVVHCDTPGSYAARNEGRRHATQDILAFTDADCLPAADWLSAAKRYYEDPTGSRRIVAGHIEVFPKSRSTISSCEAYDVAVGLPQQRYVRKGYGITANLLVPAKLFDEVGGFDETRYSGGDAEFCRRAASRNVVISFAPDVVVEHPARATWSEHSKKIRRTLGGQLTSGSWVGRIKWMIRAVLPPVLDGFRVMVSAQPVKVKVKALTLLGPIWGVRLHEMCRLIVRRRRPNRS